MTSKSAKKAAYAALNRLGVVSEPGGAWTLRHTVDLGTASVPLRVALKVPLDAEMAQECLSDPVALERLPRALAQLEAQLDLEPTRRAIRDGLAQELHAEDHSELVNCWLRVLRAEGAKVENLEARVSAGTKQWRDQRDRNAKLRELSKSLHFSAYPELYREARAIGRQITLLVGPPNSGKTYHALNELAAARTGVYLAPLRLLALEGQEKLAERGCTASLVTGEERDVRDGATHVASTIEMLNPGQRIECAVIDEAQMLYDRDRGWAWTQALVGVPAEKVLVVCSEYAVPALTALLQPLGEKIEVRRFERKQALECLRNPVRLKDLEAGDAVIAFSRKDVLMLRERLLEIGRTVSVIYGALSPEVRRKEAERFASGRSQVLVATDAIGMGLNLPVRRVLFSRLNKWNGTEEVPLGVPEFHQIAGRAGRFGLQEQGQVGCLQGYAEHSNPKVWFDRKPTAPDEDSRAWVAPGLVHVQTIAKALGSDKLSDVLEVFHLQVDLEDQRFRCAEAGLPLELARELDRAKVRLDLELRFAYANAPVDESNMDRRGLLMRWAAFHAAGQTNALPAHLIPREGSQLDLATAEDLSKSVNLYCWLALRFPDVYPQLEQAQLARRALDRRIEDLLRGKAVEGRSGGRDARRPAKNPQLHHAGLRA